MRRSLLTGLSVLLCAPFLAAQEFDRLVPDSAVAYVSLENVPRTVERYEAGALARLWADPALAKFLEKPLEKWSALMDKQRQEDGFSFEEVRSLVRGQIAFAVTRFAADTEEMDAVVLADIGDQGDKLREILARADERLAETRGFRRDEEAFGETAIVVYRSPPPEGAEEPVVEGCWFLDGKTFAYSNRVDDLKRVLARRGDAEGSLAGKEAYRAVRRRLGGRADVVAYVDGPNVLRAAAPVLGAQGPQILRALGLTKMGGIGVQGLLADDRGLHVDAFMAVDGEKEGILKLFAGENRGIRPPAFVPDDVMQVSTARIDMAGLWEEARRVADQIEENGSRRLDDAVDEIKGATGVDIVTDIFGAFGDDWTYYLKEPDPNAPRFFNVPVPRLVFTLAVKERERLEGALGALTALPRVQGLFREDEYLGLKYKVLFAVPGMTPAFAVLSDRLVVSIDVDDIKEVIARHGKDVKGIKDHEDFTRLTAHIPAEGIAVSFTREARALRQAMVWGAMSRVPGMRNLFDMQLFPKAEVLEKYLGDSLSVTRNEEDGILARYLLKFRPKPDDAADED